MVGEANGVVELALLVFLEIGQGLHVGVDGGLGLAQGGIAGAQGQVVVGVVAVEVGLLQQLEGLLGPVLHEVLPCVFHPEDAVVGVLFHGEIDGLTGAAQVVALHVIVDDQLELLGVEILGTPVGEHVLETGHGLLGQVIVFLFICVVVGEHRGR